MKYLIACALLVVSTLAEPHSTLNVFGAPSDSYGAPGSSFGIQGSTDVIFGSRQSSGYPSSVGGVRSHGSQYGAPDSTSTGFGFSLNGGPTDEYGPPSVSRIRSEYLAPLSKTSAPITLYPPALPRVASVHSAAQRATSNQNAADLRSKSSHFEHGPSSSYGVPTNGFSRGFHPSRQQNPSSSYGAPSRVAVSQEYGVPGSTGSDDVHFRGSQGQGGEYLPPGDDSNNEPANYNFDYKVRDVLTGNDFGHREARQGDRAEGMYYVLLPDGRKQTVEYEADEDGFKPKISYEDTRSEGINFNAEGYIYNEADGGQGY